MEQSRFAGRGTWAVLMAMVAFIAVAVPLTSDTVSADALEMTDEQYAEALEDWNFYMGDYGLYESSYYMWLYVAPASDGTAFGLSILADGEWITVIEFAFEVDDDHVVLTAAITEEGIDFAPKVDGLARLTVNVGSGTTLYYNVLYEGGIYTVFDSDYRGVIPDYIAIHFHAYEFDAIDIVQISGELPDHYFRWSASLNTFNGLDTSYGRVDASWGSISSAGGTTDGTFAGMTVTLTMEADRVTPPEGCLLIGYSVTPNSDTADFLLGDVLELLAGKAYMVFPVYTAICTVTLVSEGSTVETLEVGTGGRLTAPEDPSRDGYAFTGWYLDEGCTQPYDFSSVVTSDLTLYVGWSEEPDAGDGGGGTEGPDGPGDGDGSGDGSGGITGGTEDPGSDGGTDSTDDPVRDYAWLILLVLIVFVIILAVAILR